MVVCNRICIALTSLALTGFGMWLSYKGIKALPKCRYGDADCYFRVSICDAAGVCKDELFNRAIEGRCHATALKPDR